jgi:hypothetical protein
MKINFYGVSISLILFLSSPSEADILGDFLKDEISKSETLGKKHPRMVRLKKIINEKNREKALELALQYSHDQHQSTIERQEDFNRKVVFHELLVDPSKGVRATDVRAFLTELFNEGVITKISIVAGGYKVRIKAAEVGRMSRLLVGEEFKCDIKTISLILER